MEICHFYFQIFFSCILIDFLICSSESCNSVTEDCSGPEQGISHLLRVAREQVEVTSLQLAGCNTDCGRVEVKLDGGPTWLAVCADGWSLKEARVVCKQLGFKETLGAPTNYKVGKTELKKLKIACDGHEKEISECEVALADGACPREGVVGATCSTSAVKHSEQETKIAKEVFTSVSLASHSISQKIREKWHLDKNMDIDDCDIGKP